MFLGFQNQEPRAASSIMNSLDLRFSDRKWTDTDAAPAL